MKVTIVLGTRPEIIKLAPIIKKLGKKKCSVVFSGQHYDNKMGLQFIEQLGLSQPDYTMKLSGKIPPIQISEIISKLSNILSQNNPDTVIVQGDTNTVLAASICSLKHNIPVSHVEAGLRSFDWRMPEEHNRVAVDHISEMLFAPTHISKKNLVSEKVHGSIHVTGNTVIDAVNTYSKISQKKSNLDISIDDYVLTTLHRSENVDNQKTLSSITKGLLMSNVDIIFPLHPRTKKRLKEFDLYEKLNNSDNVLLFDAVGYFEMLELMKKCSFIFTDSGGIQEESTARAIRKKVIVARKSTDRPESITSKTAELVKLDAKSISEIIKKTHKHPKIRLNQTPFGDGNASTKIIRLLEKKF